MELKCWFLQWVAGMPVRDLRHTRHSIPFVLLQIVAPQRALHTYFVLLSLGDL